MISSTDEGGESEISLQEAHETLLSDPELSDFTLKSNDGYQIKVQRAMLAARSKVFRGMLYGGFFEASQAQIELDYCGAVLQALVEYMYTDEAPSILNHDVATKEEATMEDMVHKLASLMDASNYFSLKGLREKAIVFATEMMQKRPITRAIWLAECDNSAALLKDSIIEKTAFKYICKKPQILLDGESSSVTILGKPRIEKNLKQDRINGDEFMMFKILQAWADAPNGDVSAVSRQVDQAKELIQHIDLAGIGATDLSTTIASSGLVSMNQLCEAYKKQAIVAEQHGCIKKKRHLLDSWKGSNSTIFEFSVQNNIRTVTLDCEPLRPGIVSKWSIFVEKLYTDVSLALGVVSTSHGINHERYITRQNNSWCALSNGNVRSWKDWISEPGRSFQEGSTVQFTLDLTGPGSLKVIVDDRPDYILCSDMISKFNDEISVEFVEFVPVISMLESESAEPCRVEFLGFD